MLLNINSYKKVQGALGLTTHCLTQLPNFQMVHSGIKNHESAEETLLHNLSPIAPIIIIINLVFDGIRMALKYFYFKHIHKPKKEAYTIIIIKKNIFRSFSKYKPNITWRK